MRLVLIEKRRATKDVTSFIFKPEVPFSWKAGQFLRYTLLHDNPDQRGQDRYFTIASAPFENNVMLTTREGVSSFKRALFSLPVGSQILAEGPKGNFVVNDPELNYIFIAGGIGITPYRAILLDLEHKKLPIKVKLLYGNRDPDFVFKTELDDLDKKYNTFSVRYFVEPERIGESAIKDAARGFNDPLFYISGPKPMADAFKDMLQTMGIAQERIKLDYFPGYEN